ncbi:hypothetical protein ACFQH6_07980 [Halobacteriaceae archaeon GCM10025711]
MGMRPPASNGSDSPGVVTFGIPEVDAMLDEADLTFPARTAEVADAIGHRSVTYDPRGHTVTLREALERTDRERFETENDLLNALHPVFEDLRTSTATGVVGWLRTVLPF